MQPKLKSLLARVILVGGVAAVGSFAAKHAPHDQTIAIRLGNRDIKHVDAIVTKLGEEEAIAGFSQDFAGDVRSPRVVRFPFSAASGTYIVVINCKEAAAGESGPKLTETSFERRVSLVGGEVIVSPD